MSVRARIAQSLYDQRWDVGPCSVLLLGRGWGSGAISCGFGFKRHYRTDAICGLRVITPLVVVDLERRMYLNDEGSEVSRDGTVLHGRMA